MSNIVPTVGRKVYFYADNRQLEPVDATIIKVWDPVHMARPDSAVNLAIVDPYTAVVSLRSNVSVGNEWTTYQHYRWMPYQVGQAAKPLPNPIVQVAPGVPLMADAVGDQGFTRAGFLGGLVLLTMLVISVGCFAGGKGNPAALAKYRADKAAGKTSAAVPHAPRVAHQARVPHVAPVTGK